MWTLVSIQGQIIVGALEIHPYGLTADATVMSAAPHPPSHHAPLPSCPSCSHCSPLAPSIPPPHLPGSTLSGWLRNFLMKLGVEEQGR